jgi:hypothetical protein
MVLCWSYDPEKIEPDPHVPQPVQTFSKRLLWVIIRVNIFMIHKFIIHKFLFSLPDTDAIVWPCNDNSDCTVAVATSRCSNFGYCQCPAGFVFSSDFTRCIRGESPFKTYKLNPLPNLNISLWQNPRLANRVKNPFNALICSPDQHVRMAFAHVRKERDM